MGEQRLAFSPRMENIRSGTVSHMLENFRETKSMPGIFITEGDGEEEEILDYPSSRSIPLWQQNRFPSFGNMESILTNDVSTECIRSSTPASGHDHIANDFFIPSRFTSTDRMRAYPSRLVT